MIGHPNPVIMIPLRQDKRRHVRSDLNNFTIIKANPSNMLTLFSYRRLDSKMRHVITNKSNLLHQGPPCEIVHYICKTSVIP